jgi:hypothetical protein
MPTAEESDSLRRGDIDEWLATSSSGAAFDGSVSSERRELLGVIIVYASYSPATDIRYTDTLMDGGKPNTITNTYMHV